MLWRLVAQNIRRLREARGWTQAQLAEKAGMDARNLSRLETEERGAGLATLEHLARGFQLPPYRLLMPERETRTLEAREALILSLKREIQGLGESLARAEEELEAGKAAFAASQSLLEKLEASLTESEAGSS